MSLGLSFKLASKSKTGYYFGSFKKVGHNLESIDMSALGQIVTFTFVKISNVRVVFGNLKMQLVTVLYYTESDLRLCDQSLTLEESENGRVIIPAEFKVGKQIVAVLEGECRLLSRLGERVLPLSAETDHNEGIDSLIAVS